jgi:hypothetical protein
MVRGYGDCDSGYGYGESGYGDSGYGDSGYNDSVWRTYAREIKPEDARPLEGQEKHLPTLGTLVVRRVQGGVLDLT